MEDTNNLSSVQSQTLPFIFTGKGSEYFSIWIVNLALSIVTLGIYSAWAKVRKLQYLYRNTSLAGSSFDYHGNPIAILKGRGIALAALIGMQLALQFAPIVGLVLLLLIFGVMAWMIKRSLQFKLYNSSYRGLRFSFHGSTGGAYRVFLGLTVAAALLGFLWPYTHHQIKSYQQNNSRYGQTDFTFSGTVGQFYKVYLIGRRNGLGPSLRWDDDFTAGALIQARNQAPSKILRMTTPIPWPPSLSGTYIRRTMPGFLEKLEANMSPVSKASVVTLREIAKDTVRIVSLLDVGPGQDGLVAPNAFSIAQAYYSPYAWFRAIYADETPVGFVMLDDWSQVTDQEPELYKGERYVALWRFMIDQRFQKFGFGAQAIELLIAHARTRPGAKTMLLSFVPKENNPEAFYARFGFVRTGEIDEGEVVMKLPLV